MSGFAIRLNGSCPASDTNCGAGAAPFNVCCPNGAFCLSQYNRNCCDTAANCTAALVQNPYCANSTWDLYDNNGFFCCEAGTRGYAATLSDSSGCASDGYQLQTGEVFLHLIKSGSPSATTSTFSLPTSSSTTTPTTSPEPAPASSVNAGPIAGGVIGGVALLAIVGALIWFWRRKQTKNTGIAFSELSNDSTGYSGHQRDYKGGYAPPGYPAIELAETHGVSELHDPRSTPQAQRVELPG